MTQRITDAAATTQCATCGGAKWVGVWPAPGNRCLNCSGAVAMSSETKTPSPAEAVETLGRLLALQRDAERYRWLRLADDNGPRTMQMQYHHVEHLDRAIDTAIAKEKL